MKSSFLMVAFAVWPLTAPLVQAATESPPADPKPPLTLAEALARALERSPALAAHPANVRIAEARRVQASLRPAPVVSLSLEDFAGSGPYQGFQVSQNTLTLSRVIEWGDKRAARGAVAENERARVDANYAQLRAEVLGNVTEAFIEVVGNQHRLAWSRQAVQLAEETLGVLQQRLRAAAASPLEEKRARITLARARIAEEHEQHELQTARRRLAALWGDTEAAFGEARADLFLRPTVPDYDALVARIVSSPELARWASEKHVRAAEWRLAQSRRRPDLTAALGVRQYAATDDAGLVFQLSLPLGSRSRAAGLEAEARAQQDLADLGARETELRLRTALFGLAQELRHARTELDALEKEILPQAQSALQLARTGVAQGRFSPLELLETRRTVLEAQRDRIQAALVFHQLVARLETILGEPIHTSTESSTPEPATPNP
jgi:cobalt-zinc-cadmium efflux system outer membrane protein